MGLFGLGKKRDVVDLGEMYRRQQERTERIKEDAGGSSNIVGLPSASSTGFGFLGNMAGVGSSNSFSSNDSDSEGYVDASSSDDKKRKLAKRLVDMTDKIEELSNQIYHLQQRLEVLEQRFRVGVGG